MQSEIDLMLAGSPMPDAEEVAFHAYDELPSSLGEYPGLDKIVECVEFIEALEERGLPSELMLDLMNDGGLDRLEDYAGEGDTLVDWCEGFIEDTGLLAEVPEELRYYFDVASYARDMSVTTYEANGKVYVFFN
jgi:antirestriction protein